MKSFLRIAVVIMSLVFTLPFAAFGLDSINASLAQLPVAAESTEKGVYIDLLKAINKESGIPIQIKVVPFARSMNNVIEGKADLHIPLIKSPYHKTPPPYDYSTVSLYPVNFVLYTNKMKPISKEQLNTASVETDIAHTGYFPFKTIPSSCIECSLKKVDHGRIDAFIFADSVTDDFIKKNNLKNIKRELYQQFDVKVILPKGQKGGDIDQLLSRSIKHLRESGEFQKIIKPLNIPYDNWQP